MERLSELGRFSNDLTKNGWNDGLPESMLANRDMWASYGGTPADAALQRDLKMAYLHRNQIDQYAENPELSYQDMMHNYNDVQAGRYPEPRGWPEGLSARAKMSGAALPTGAPISAEVGAMLSDHLQSGQDAVAWVHHSGEGIEFTNLADAGFHPHEVGMMMEKPTEMAATLARTQNNEFYPYRASALMGMMREAQQQQATRTSLLPGSASDQFTEGVQAGVPENHLASFRAEHKLLRAGLKSANPFAELAGWFSGKAEDTQKGTRETVARLIAGRPSEVVAEATRHSRAAMPGLVFGGNAKLVPTEINDGLAAAGLRADVRAQHAEAILTAARANMSRWSVPKSWGEPRPVALNMPLSGVSHGSPRTIHVVGYEISPPRDAVDMVNPYTGASARVERNTPLFSGAMFVRGADGTADILSARTIREGRFDSGNRIEHAMTCANVMHPEKTAVVLTASSGSKMCGIVKHD